MNEGEGGGASRSTDPAAGTSSATDVSLREFVAAQMQALDRHLLSEISALRREMETANANADKAIDVAKNEASERLIAHNGLIDQMQKLQATFATRENLDHFIEANNSRIGRAEKFQYTLTGGLILFSFVGIANIIKVWAG